MPNIPKTNLKRGLETLETLLRVANTPEHPDHKEVVKNFSHCDAFEDAWPMYALLNRVHEALVVGRTVDAKVALAAAGWSFPPVEVPLATFLAMREELRGLAVTRGGSQLNQLLDELDLVVKL